MEKESNLVKKTLYYDKDEYEELCRRAKLLGTQGSKIIRQLIAEYNLKPFLADFEYKTTNYTKSNETTLKTTLKKE